MSDYISRQAAIDAICNACGKIDCDKMDKCEKLQLPPANCSEIPNNSDTISRQAAIDALKAQAGTLRTLVEPYANQRVGILTAVNIVEDIKPSDVAPVVRCRDCKFRENDDFCTGRGFPYQLVPDDGFCDKGERKE